MPNIRHSAEQKLDLTSVIDKLWVLSTTPEQYELSCLMSFTGQTTSYSMAAIEILFEPGK
jgi:hypothetical protein